MDKKYSQRVHFKNRVAERLGLNINRVDIINLVASIYNKDNIFKSYRISGRKTVYDMMFKNNRCYIFFDHNRKTPITVYTREMGIQSILGENNARLC
jgi:hypothetical protein